MKTSLRCFSQCYSLAIATLLTLTAVSMPLYAGQWSVSCSCGIVHCVDDDCDGFEVVITPHDKIFRTQNIAYSPNSSGNEQFGVLDYTKTFIKTVNATDEPMCNVTEHPGQEINESRTISVGGEASAEYTSSAELSYGVASASVEYTLGFKVTGEYTVQQGIKVSHSIDHGPLTIPARHQTKYSARFYKDTCDVDVTQEKRVSHLGNCATCTVRTGVVGSFVADAANASSFRYVSIAIVWHGMEPIPE